MTESDPLKAPSFAYLVQAFFAEHLLQHRAVSPCTVATYRDAFVLFLDFTQIRLHKLPTAMRLDEITPTLILDFLDHLERDRGNAVRTRNARLAALRAFLKFAGRRDVSALHAVEKALGVPMKRFEQPMLGYLTREEMQAIIGRPGKSWTTQRDHLLFRMLYNTGARVSEIIAVTRADVVLDSVACVHLHGKGRKLRTVPLWRSTVKHLRAWLRRNPDLQPTSALLPNRAGQAMTRGNVTQRLALAVKAAAATQPTTPSGGPLEVGQRHRIGDAERLQCGRMLHVAGRRWRREANGCRLRPIDWLFLSDLSTDRRNSLA